MGAGTGGGRRSGGEEERLVRIALVDDTSDVRAVIRALLEHHGGYEVVAEAADGAEALAMVQREQPDIVLLDLAMPVMDGLTALPRTRRVAPGTVVVVLSAFGNDQTVRAAMAQGAAAFVKKGGSLIEDLLPALAEVLAANTRLGELG